MILPLSQQVPSLELCKRLRELGFPQETYFLWDLSGRSAPVVVPRWTYDSFPEEWRRESVAAPTVAELIHVLGDKFGVLERFVTPSSGKGNFGCYVPQDIGTNGIGDSPVEALAELWLFLLEMELI